MWLSSDSFPTPSVFQLVHTLLFVLLPRLHTEPVLPWLWAIVPSPCLSGSPAVNSSQVFGFCSAGAWHALCFWLECLFVPDSELEIRLRRSCTCIPFTSHLISLSHYHWPSLSLLYTLCFFYMHACIQLLLLQGGYFGNVCEKCTCLIRLNHRTEHHDTELCA